MKIVVDRLLCDGNGLCALEAPDLFELNDNEELLILQESVPEDALARAERAVAACPKAALSLLG